MLVVLFTGARKKKQSEDLNLYEKAGRGDGRSASPKEIVEEDKNGYVVVKIIFPNQLVK
jgi:hypothetical protein